MGINRFVTIDKIRKDDTERNSRPRFREGKTTVNLQENNSRSYKSIKEEQIKISQGRSDFQNNTANRIPNSPKPYRRGVSETRIDRQEKTCDCKKTRLCLAIIDELPSDVKCALLSHQLSTLSNTTL